MGNLFGGWGGFLAGTHRLPRFKNVDNRFSRTKDLIKPKMHAHRAKRAH